MMRMLLISAGLATAAVVPLSALLFPAVQSAATEVRQGQAVEAHGPNGKFSVTKVDMPDGTTCYAAMESGHSIALHCFRK